MDIGHKKVLLKYSIILHDKCTNLSSFKRGVRCQLLTEIFLCYKYSPFIILGTISVVGPPQLCPLYFHIIFFEH